MFLLFDIGASKTRIALSKDRSDFEKPIIFDTGASFEEGMREFVRQAKTLTNKPIQGIAGGITGTLNKERTELARSPNLSEWVGHPLEKSLRQSFNCPVFIENDAAIVGLGEAFSGAGMGYSIVMYMTISTGVGGARIVDGQIDEHAFGFEPGWEIVDMQSTLEELVSGAAIERRFGKKPYDIPQTDPIWDELAEKLAYGLHNSIVHWSPDVIVLGGSMIVGDPYIDVALVEKHLKIISRIYPQTPLVKKAQLGAVGGLHGALHYLNSRLG